jgi:hypothetical protein
MDVALPLEPGTARKFCAALSWNCALGEEILCGEVGRDSRAPLSLDARISVGDTEKGEANIGPLSSPDVCMRGSVTGLSDDELVGSSEETGDWTAESSMLMVGARCLCCCLGVPGPCPSAGVDISTIQGRVPSPIC